jgi:hypothetical protein
LEVAALELDCTPNAVHVSDYGDHVQAKGCRLLVYFVKHSETHWERAGPRFELSSEDIVDEEPRPGEEELPPGKMTPPVRITGSVPSLSDEEWRKLTAWEVKAISHCILRVDGTLQHCAVFAPDPVVAEAVSKSLRAWRYAPATFRGRPVPIELVQRFKFRFHKPACSQLSSPMRRFECERAAEQLNPSEQTER